MGNRKILFICLIRWENKVISSHFRREIEWALKLVRGKFVCLLLRDRSLHHPPALLFSHVCFFAIPSSSPLKCYPLPVRNSGFLHEIREGGHHKNEENRILLVKKKMIQLICRRFLGLILREAKRITLLWWCWCRVLVDLLSFYSSNSYKSIKCLVSPLFFKYCSNNMSSNKLLMVERLFFLRTLMICLGGTCEMWYVFRFSFVLKLTELLLFSVSEYNTSSMVKIIQ